MKNSWIEYIFKGSIIIAICAIFFIIALVIVAPLFTKDEVIATVVDKAVYTTTSCSKNSCSSTTHFMIYTDKEPFDISDSFLLWEFGAPQKYGEVKIGHTYKFKVYGWYIQMIQMYRSAYRVDLIE